MSTLPNIRTDIEGSFDKLEQLDAERLEQVKWMVAHFYLRDGVMHEDGSRGTLRMTPGQLRNLIAYAILQERNNDQDA